MKRARPTGKGRKTKDEFRQFVKDDCWAEGMGCYMVHMILPHDEDERWSRTPIPLPPMYYRPVTEAELESFVDWVYEEDA